MDSFQAFACLVAIVSLHFYDNYICAYCLFYYCDLSAALSFSLVDSFHEIFKCKCDCFLKMFRTVQSCECVVGSAVSLVSLV